jgi:hypothetical protein
VWGAVDGFSAGGPATHQPSEPRIAFLSYSRTAARASSWAAGRLASSASSGYGLGRRRLAGASSGLRSAPSFPRRGWAHAQRGGDRARGRAAHSGRRGRAAHPGRRGRAAHPGRRGRAAHPGRRGRAAHPGHGPDRQPQPDKAPRTGPRHPGRTGPRQPGQPPRSSASHCLCSFGLTSPAAPIPGRSRSARPPGC